MIGTVTVVIAGTALGSLVLHRSKQNLDKRFPERHRFTKALMYLSWGCS